MPPPTGPSPSDQNARRKYDAWKSEEGLTRTEAKRRYISYLIETMKLYASGTHEARELLSELEYLWDQIKDIEPSPSPPMTPVLQGSLGTSLYGDSFLDSRSFSQSHGVGGYTGSQEYLSRDVAVLKKEVGLALRRINQELNQINEKNKNNINNDNDKKDDKLLGKTIMGVDIKVLKKIGFVLFKFLGGVVKRFLVDIVILISLIKFIKIKNGLDINLLNSGGGSGTGSMTNTGFKDSYFNKILITMFKILNKANLINFNRLYIEID